nr:hypothetical protein [Tanacetum cinerariifolium]
MVTRLPVLCLCGMANPDVNLLKEDVGNDLIWVKLHGVPVTAFSEDNLSVIATKPGTPLMFDSYTLDTCILSWGSSSYIRAMIEVRTDVELKDTIIAAMPKLVGDGFYTCTISVDISTTPIVEKTDKLERLIIDEKLTRVDDEGKPLKKVDYLGDHDSEDEVKLVDNEMASFLASKRVDYGTNRLLEYWKKTYENADYDYDPYDDDMHEGQEIHDIIQSMCDNLDIK